MCVHYAKERQKLTGNDSKESIRALEKEYKKHLKIVE